ncbi:MAG: tetratricopeptide repeat protein [Lewinellaceae bacterium]|nr:tetratricopeptide repeat protein [Lewinellaceae bacterium]
MERSRALQGERTSLEQLQNEARAHLTATQISALDAFEQTLAAAESDTDRIAALKKMSGWWYQQGQIPVAGGLAEQVAELENTDTAWSVAGATFYNALRAEQNAVLRAFCGDHAIKAFESAISLRPEHVEHRVNLALVYAEYPPKDNPMKAVLLLRELESKYPENAAVYNALGRLAIKTGQWERAIQRLEKAMLLDPENPNTPCLLARAYEEAGNKTQAAAYAARCQAQ